MDDKLKQEIIGYLTALFNQARSNAIEKLDLYKVVEFINETFRIQLDPDDMDEILNSIDIVSDINDSIITIGEAKPENEEDQEAIDNVESTAADQAMEDLTSESFVGKELDINKIKLNESMDGLNRLALLMYANDNPKYVQKLGKSNAIEAVKYALMDPSNMSDFEKNVMKKIVPFYTFTKQNLLFKILIN
jgi:ABC-type antimicrobial peptide transport system permease subunit